MFSDMNFDEQVEVANKSLHDELMTIANDVFKEVESAIPYSSNRPSRENQPIHRSLRLTAMRSRSNPIKNEILTWDMKIDRLTPPENESEAIKMASKGDSSTSLIKLLNDLRLKDRANKQCHRDGAIVTALESIEADAKNTTRFGIGNCKENASLVFMLLLDSAYAAYHHVSVEILFIPGEGDHGFVVKNRDPNSQLDQLSTWGRAIIIDPWLGSVVDVQKELGLSEKEQSECFKYIQSYHQLLRIYHTAPMGSGHSERWTLHRERKNQPSTIRAWIQSGQLFHQPTKNIPWVNDKLNPEHFPIKKRKRQTP